MIGEEGVFFVWVFGCVWMRVFDRGLSSRGVVRRRSVDRGEVN